MTAPSSPAADTPDAAVLDAVATELLDREAGRRDGGKLTERFPGLDLDLGYRAQDVLVERKLAAGERLVGAKLGLTSEAKQRRMGIDAPLTAWLTDTMVLEPGAPAVLGELIHPRVEPEIVFVMGEDLAGPGVTPERALAAVEKVAAGYEVIDSRYTDFKFTLPDVVADNASAARFGVSSRLFDPADLDLIAEEAVLRVDGREVDRATGAAVQGNPAAALALAANDLGRRGKKLEAGWIVLTGGMTDAVFLHPGQTVSVDFATLGSIAVTGA
ncbi:2-keto-4-pentenoate hydratase [Streptomyces sp. RB5]|uniref:2-keto-4-pentenoate hydratase n=1 Tax=Streptomyces smaragdinus TaxID=2585196 RepID=A0A7K0CM05_9ACTN|nr:fumarylacetoacetate hydrolase family protein [Streptomyces smaragdinus]MQY14516.1 2-keto-4-pentenoate hydratase [Streptomyces smaragdinus]